MVKGRIFTAPHLRHVTLTTVFDTGKGTHS